MSISSGENGCTVGSEGVGGVGGSAVSSASSSVPARLRDQNEDLRERLAGGVGGRAGAGCSVAPRCSEESRAAPNDKRRARFSTKAFCGDGLGVGGVGGGSSSGGRSREKDLAWRRTCAGPDATRSAPRGRGRGVAWPLEPASSSLRDLAGGMWGGSPTASPRPAYASAAMDERSLSSGVGDREGVCDGDDSGGVAGRSLSKLAARWCQTWTGMNVVVVRVTVWVVVVVCATKPELAAAACSYGGGPRDCSWMGSEGVDAHPNLR